MRIPAHGRGKLRIGGTNKGGPGRPPDEFYREMRRLVSTDEKLKTLDEILKNKNHPNYMAAYKMAAEFGYGKASQKLEHTGKDGAPLYPRAINIRIVDPEQT